MLLIGHFFLLSLVLATVCNKHKEQHDAKAAFHEVAREASLPAASISSPSASSSASAAEMSTSSCASFLGAAERRFCCRRSWSGLYDVVGV